MKLVVVGSNPSQKSPDLSAFSPMTVSGKRVRTWFLSFPEAIFVNVSDVPTAHNRPLKRSEIALCLDDLLTKIADADRIVAVGRTASIALTKLGVAHYMIPHPSGRNRLLNDPNYLKLQHRYLVEYLTNHA